MSTIQMKVDLPKSMLNVNISNIRFEISNRLFMLAEKYNDTQIMLRKDWLGLRNKTTWLGFQKHCLKILT